MNIDLDDALQAVPFPRPREMWQYAHNADVTADPDAGHAPLMGLLRTIADYAAVRDPFVVEKVVAPLLVAAHAALNLERGNLDGGRLSEWLDTLAELLDINL
jgi:hypothetical protein